MRGVPSANKIVTLFLINHLEGYKKIKRQKCTRGNFESYTENKLFQDLLCELNSPISQKRCLTYQRGHLFI